VIIEEQTMGSFATCAFCALVAIAAMTVPASAEAITLSCAYDRYNPNGNKIGSGAERLTIDFDRQQWMLVDRPKTLYHLYAFDGDTITLAKREGVPGTQVYDMIERNTGSYQILHLSSNPLFYRDKEGICTKEHLVQLPTRKFRLEEYPGP
jgi:hypothetical protein